MSNVKAVARTAIDLAAQQGLSVTNLKLQKLLYFAHGLALAKYGTPLIRGEKFEAWKYGPVLESLYHDLKVFGTSMIGPNDGFVAHWSPLPVNAKDERNALASTLAQLGSMSGGKLIDISHDPRGPWHAVFNATTKNIAIEDDSIKAYFETIVKK